MGKGTTAGSHTFYAGKVDGSEGYPWFISLFRAQPPNTSHPALPPTGSSVCT